MRTWILIAVVASAACAQIPAQYRGAIVGAATGAAVASLPIGPEKERQIGFGIAATVAGRYEVLDDPELTRYVNLVGQAVAQQSVRRGEVDFHFGVLDTDEVNAFAAPGGYIWITRGAIELMDSEAELAGVLAHEVGHVDEKHILDEIRQADVLKTVKDEAQLEGPVLDQIAEAGTSALLMGLSREDEMEADSVGLLYAAATGYRVDGLVQFLSALHEKIEAEIAQQAEQAGGDSGLLKQLRASHPATGERVEVLERQISARGMDPQSGRAVADRFRQHTSGAD